MTVDTKERCPRLTLAGPVGCSAAAAAHSAAHDNYIQWVGGILLALLLALPLPTNSAAQSSTGDPIEPVPLDAKLDQRKVSLGRSLFNDSRLSAGNGTSCASCHYLTMGLTDQLPISRGLPGYPGVVNTSSLFNVGLNSKFTWSGRLWTLEDHTNGVIENKSTMGAKWEDVIATLNKDAGITAEFEAIFKDGLKRQNVIEAIVAYEHSLNTPNAPFDRYLRGDQAAINEEAKLGYQLFKDYGCISCHQGVNVGGNMLQVFGIFGTTAAATETPGSAAKTGISDDRPVFRVPSLRNVAHTAPYFHDGSVTTLRGAIDVMANNQLGRKITDLDAARLEAFLKSLTGEYQGVSLDDMGR
ncbi:MULTISPECIES: cytochrome-c peroxidase [unclassified Neorhizobium]|uniref:cytochrome-c peroxidase n=1 Tax=unclassified Neorhizobium TaxID=2629175 RepID=UPI001FF5BE94|nr:MULTISPECIES: cytochrome c peroxidase [unclassified Neorhizobium]MCJ9671602.1 c-type cytochrome [Neorhizobium sp. SHOUNA12B]MCJ9747731.1 c-type cytochrome [Neorhizobium sp. SHOUNA12A]